MATIVIPTEDEIRKWVKEAVKESLETAKPKEVLVTNVQEQLLSPKMISKELGVSEVTLRAWRKEGMPAHKQKRKVYFLHTEVLEYMTKKKPKKKYDWL